MGRFRCFVGKCNKPYTLATNLRRHLLVHAPSKRHTCATCQKQYARADDYNSHIRSCRPLLPQSELLSEQSVSSAFAQPSFEGNDGVSLMRVAGGVSIPSVSGGFHDGGNSAGSRGCNSALSSPDESTSAHSRKRFRDAAGHDDSIAATPTPSSNSLLHLLQLPREPSFAALSASGHAVEDNYAGGASAPLPRHTATSAQSTSLMQGAVGESPSRF